MNRTCMICKVEPAPFGIGWPGFRSEMPPAMRGRRLWVCSLAGDCAVAATLRVVRAMGGRPFPWSTVTPALRDAVQALIAPAAEPPPEPDVKAAPAATPPPTPRRKRAPASPETQFSLL